MLPLAPSMLVSALAAAAMLAGPSEAKGKPTFAVNNLPKTWEEGQTGTNQCKQWQPSSQKSKCQNVFINNVNDFCLWGPPKTASVGSSEEIEVAYCTKPGYGTRLMPAGTIKSAHFIKTPNFLQISGHGDFTKIHIQAQDEGGELDPHGADGNGNPRGGLVYSNNVPGKEGQWTQIKEWSNFMGATEFSIRAAYGRDAAKWAPHIYDVMGSQWNHPGSYSKGFDECEADSGHFPGIYHNGASTFYQGQSHTPAAHKPGKSSQCHSYSTIDSSKLSQLPYKRRSQRDA